MPKRKSDGEPTSFPAEVVPVESLHPHPKNYRQHTDDQLDHIVTSIKEHGFYRNVVIAKDGTILAGHGVVLACRKMAIERIPVIRLDVEPDDPRALKVLTGDNEIARLAEVNDRALTELLRDIKQRDVTGLLGTGYDDQMLAALVMVTRPASEIADFDAAAEWTGMPEFDAGTEEFVVIISCTREDAMDDLALRLGINRDFGRKYRKGKVWSFRWPRIQESTLTNVEFVGEKG